MKCGIWNIQREIGRGAYGTVYLAQGGEGRVSAVKVVEKSNDHIRYERELHGVRLFMKIPSSEGLAHIIDWGEMSNGFWYATELADDEFDRTNVSHDEYRPKTLASVIATEKALPLERCVDIGMGLLKGLETLQRHHLLHRDIKPGNILFINGAPVLSDPGLLVEESDSVSIVGTPGYVPPESFVSAGGDIFSLGLTLKAASFGRPVDELEKGPSIEADISNTFFARWWQILNKATNADESLRYRSAKAFRQDLKRFRTQTGIVSIVSSKTTLAALGVAMLILIGTLIFFTLKQRNNDKEVMKWVNFLEQAETEAKTNALCVSEEAKQALEKEIHNINEILGPLKDRK